MLFTELDTLKEKNPKPENSLCVTVVTHLANQIARREDYFSVRNLEEEEKKEVDYIDGLQIVQVFCRSQFTVNS